MNNSDAFERLTWTALLSAVAPEPGYRAPLGDLPTPCTLQVQHSMSSAFLSAYLICTTAMPQVLSTACRSVKRLLLMFVLWVGEQRGDLAKKMFSASLLSSQGFHTENSCRPLLYGVSKVCVPRLGTVFLMQAWVPLPWCTSKSSRATFLIPALSSRLLSLQVGQYHGPQLHCQAFGQHCHALRLQAIDGLYPAARLLCCELQLLLLGEDDVRDLPCFLY